jgi:hypothetical protein
MKAGVITDEWETLVPAGRLPRRLYRPAFSQEWYRANGLLPEGDH